MKIPQTIELAHTSNARQKSPAIAFRTNPMKVIWLGGFLSPELMNRRLVSRGKAVRLLMRVSFHVYEETTYIIIIKDN